MLTQEPLSGLEGLQAQRGSIVNVASLCGIAVMPGLGAYNASKHAVVRLAAVDAREYAYAKIRINTVCPGVTDTPMLRVSRDQDFLDEAEKQCPMNRVLDPREVAAAVVFLSGSRASGITGVALPVDGGAHLYRAI